MEIPFPTPLSMQRWPQLFLCLLVYDPVSSGVRSLESICDQPSDEAQLAEGLPNMHKALGSTPTPQKARHGGTCLVIPAFLAGGSEVQVYPQLYRESEASLGRIKQKSKQAAIRTCGFGLKSTALFTLFLGKHFERHFLVLLPTFFKK